MNEKNKRKIKSKKLSSLLRLYFLSQICHCGKNFKRLLRYAFQIQKKKINFGLCRYFEIDSDLRTYCVYNTGKKKKISLKKGDKNCCFPTNHGNCAKRQVEKKEHLKEFVCTK